MQELSSFFTSVLGVSPSVGDKLAVVSLVVTVVAAIVGVVQTLFGVLQWKEARIASARDVGRAAKALHAQSVASYTRDDLRHVARSYVE